MKISIYTILFIFLLFHGCKTQDHIYRKPIEGPVQTLNPKFTRFRADFMIAKTIFGQFLNYDSFGNIQPGIFKSWHVSDDGKTYIFNIDTTIKFHDEREISVDDVIFTFNFLAEKDSLVSRYFKNIIGFDDFILGKIKSISGIKKISNNQVQINLINKSFVFLSQLADPKIVLLPFNLRNQKESDFFKHPIGAGSYKLRSINEDGTYLSLERFENFKGNKSNIKFFEIQVYEKNIAKKMFLNNELEDLEVYIFDKSEFEYLKNYGNIFSASSYSVNLLLFNGRLKNFQNKQTRNLIAQSINVSKLAETCEHQVIPTTGLVPHGLLGWSNDKDIITPKVNQKNSATKRKKLKILAYGYYPRQCVLSEIINGINKQTDFEAVLDFQSDDEAVKSFLKGNYDVLLDDLSVRGPEPLNIFSFFDPLSPHNLTYFYDKNISQKLIDIEGMVGGQRAVAYSELSHYIAQDQSYAIPLYTDVRIFIFNKKIESKESPTTLLGNTPFEKINL